METPTKKIAEQSAGDVPESKSPRIFLDSLDLEEQTQASFPSSPSNGGDALNVTADLENTLAENVLLKKELCDKVEQIINLKSKLTEAFSRPAEAYEFHFPNLERTQHFLERSGELTLELDPSSSLVRRGHGQDFSEMFNDTLNRTYNLSESLVEWVEENREEMIHKVGTGGLRLKEVALGGLCGYTTGLVLKKFGKVAVTALGGGLLLLQLANYNGYVVVNWTQIYRQLEREAQDEDDWLTRKVNNVRQWSSRNSFSLLGFLGGFLYKTYT